MNAGARLAAFGAALAVVFGASALAGAAVDPNRSDSPEESHLDDSTREPHATGQGSAAADAVRGLAVADEGLRLVVDDAELSPGRAESIGFRIVDQGGGTVREFDVEHERRMHLIVARRDLASFQHLHPEQAGDGSWSAELRLAAPGSYRLFADFGHEGERYTLASDLRADGQAELRPLPASEPVAVTDGYEVRLDAGRAPAGEERELRFAVMKDGVPVRTEPYLGAGGHLVALREGDLAFLHVHPTEGGHGAHEGAAGGDGVGFAATFPTAGRYRLFLQFKHEGRVRTAAFTHEVG